MSNQWAHNIQPFNKPGANEYQQGASFGRIEPAGAVWGNGAGTTASSDGVARLVHADLRAAGINFTNWSEREQLDGWSRLKVAEMEANLERAEKQVARLKAQSMVNAAEHRINSAAGKYAGYSINDAGRAAVNVDEEVRNAIRRMREDAEWDDYFDGPSR